MRLMGVSIHGIGVSKAQKLQLVQSIRASIWVGTRLIAVRCLANGNGASKLSWPLVLTVIGRHWLVS